jgi:glutathione reductase (NADPH)
VRQAGWSVAIVDERPFGGTCALRGCDPKKVLVGAAELVDWSRRMDGHGVCGESRIAWRDLMRFKRTFTDPVPQDREAAFNAAGIATYHGTACFSNPTTLSIGDDTDLDARHVVIATGAEPARLSIPGEDLLLTSEGFLELPDLPERVLFVGGGYIAFEFAHIAARAGARPIIVQRGEHVLAGFDPHLVSKLVDVTRSLGVDVRLGTEVTGIELTGEGFRVALRAAGEEQLVPCTLAVHAAGRNPNLGQLRLDLAGVAFNGAGISVNEYLQSRSNPAVYAGGDVADAGGLPLTPVAGCEGELIARNLLDSNRHSMDFAGLVSIVYTTPPLGMAGLTESRAQDLGLHYTVHEGDSTEWYSSRRVRARRSSYRILAEDETRYILGAHVLGHDAEELLNIFSLAIRERIPAPRLVNALFAYPTAASDISSMLG